jgi:hypothetical protein
MYTVGQYISIFYFLHVLIILPWLNIFLSKNFLDILVNKF